MAILLPTAIAALLWFIPELLDSADSRRARIVVAVAATAAILVLLLLGLHQFGRYLRRKLVEAQRKSADRHESAAIGTHELADFRDQLVAEAARFTKYQLDVFALSVADPAAIRRRVTDQYEVEQRVVRRRTLFEFDLGLASLAPHSQSRESDAAPSDIPAETKYVAVLLSQKGRLHDYAMITDGQGNAVSALSYPEFRILAGLTLRRLLLAAFGDAPVPAPFLELERRYFELFLQFGVVTKDDDEINTERRRDRILAELDALALRVPDEGQAYVRTLRELVKALATNYAVVAAVPAETSQRFFLTFESTEIPALGGPEPPARTKLRMLVGARPLALQVDTDNALTCQSYHLLVAAPDDMYLANFAAPFMKQKSNPPRTDSRVSYHRFRGRRGQNYCHLYSRIARDVRSGIKPEELKVRLQFFEVPPGSIGRAAISASAGFVTITAVAMAYPVDANIAVFLLALPGIAAVWLGLEANQPRLLEGTLAARFSLGATLLASLAASILLLVQRSTEDAGSPDRFGLPYVLWLVVMAIAASNAAIMGGLYLERSRYYRAIATRLRTDASVVYVD